MDIKKQINAELAQNMGNVIPPSSPAVPTQQETDIPSATPSRSDLEERNFVAMRKKIEEEERKRIAAEARARELEEKHRLYENKPVMKVEEEDDSIDDADGYVYQKHLQKTSKKFKQEIGSTKQELEQLKRELQELKAETEIKSRTDFDDVVTDDNMKILARLYPDEYNAVYATNDMRARTRLAYNMLKNYGIVQAKPEIKRQETIYAAEKKIAENREKPVSSAGWAQASPSSLTQYGKYDADGRLRLDKADIDRINANMRKKRGIYSN